MVVEQVVLPKRSRPNDVTVSLSDGKTTVQYGENLTSPEQLKSAVIDAVYGIDASNITQKAQGKGCCG